MIKNLLGMTIFVSSTLWGMDCQLIGETANKHTGPINTVAFHPNGTIIATGSDDKTVKLWSIISNKLIHSFKHSDKITSVAFNSTGTILASASTDGTVSAWSHAQATLKSEFHNMSGAVTCIAFHPTTNCLALGCESHHVKLWNIDTPTLTQELTSHTAPVKSLAFNPDGTMLSSLSTDKIITFNFNDLIHGLITQAHTTFNSVIYNPTCSSMVATTENGNIIVLNNSDQSVVWENEGFDGGFQICHNGIAIDLTGSVIARGEATTIQLIDYDTGILKQTLHKPRGMIKAIAFNPTNKMVLVSVDDNAAINLWHNMAPTRQLLILLQALHPRCGANSPAKVLPMEAATIIFSHLTRITNFGNTMSPKSNLIQRSMTSIRNCFMNPELAAIVIVYIIFPVSICIYFAMATINKPSIHSIYPYRVGGSD